MDEEFGFGGIKDANLNHNVRFFGDAGVSHGSGGSRGSMMVHLWVRRLHASLPSALADGIKYKAGL